MNCCPDCPRKYNPIPGDGPQPSPYLLIGERPGKNEHLRQKVFVGKTGQELDETYLPLAHLHRPDVRVCNAVRCWADNNRTPTDREIASCSRHFLPREIEETRPDVIFLMGGSACRMVPSIRLDTHHGIPQWGTLFGWEGWIVPMYHPAIGLHESRWMTQLLEDWENVTGLLSSASRVRPEYKTDYRMIQSVRDLCGYLSVCGLHNLSCDTEDHGGVPWSVQLSYAPGVARLIQATDKESISYLADWALVSAADWVFHYAAHDLDILAGMSVEPTQFRDTMQEAFHLGNLPQALKPMVYRLFRHTMTSWEDVVRPYSIEALIEWLVSAHEIAQRDLFLIDVVRLKTKVRETVKKGPLESLCDRLILHTSPTSDYDPWERLKEFWSNDANDWMTSHVEARIGRYPILGIANAPLTRAITYACGDADWTGQVASELARRRRDPLWTVADCDVDHLD